MLRRVLAQTQIQRVLDGARKYHTIGYTHVSCKAAAILRCASNAGRAQGILLPEYTQSKYENLYDLLQGKCRHATSIRDESRDRTSQSFTTRKPKYYYYYSSHTLGQSKTKHVCKKDQKARPNTKQQNAEFGITPP